MRNILKLLLIIALFVFSANADYPSYTSYDISLNFEVTESAMDQFIRLQLFPAPVGTYTDGSNSYSYSISIFQPDIEVASGSVTFSSAIIASVTLLGNTVSYTYPISVPVSIPTDSISVNDIKGFLEDIPDEINNISTGPQWLKNIIIDAYEDLELSLYPEQFLEDINDQIPDDLDIVIEDIEFSWTALTEKLQITVSVPCSSRAPFVEKVNSWDESSTQYKIQFRSNVFLRILNIEMYNSSLGQNVANGSTAMTIPAPTNGNDVGATVTVTLNANSGYYFNSGNYIIRVVFGNDYGWFSNSWSCTILN
jgi:hypothetical protein